jgi:hypothetical protein
MMRSGSIASTITRTISSSTLFGTSLIYLPL